MPRLKAFTVKGSEAQPGDHLHQYEHQAPVRVGAMWCGCWPGSTSYDRNSVSFRQDNFPWFQGRISAQLEYTVQRSGVYIEGWSPEDCDKRRQELQSLTA